MRACWNPRFSSSRLTRSSPISSSSGCADQCGAGFTIFVADSIDEACTLLGIVNPDLVVVHLGQENTRYEQLDRLLWTSSVVAPNISVLVIAGAYRVNQATLLHRMGVSEYISRTHHSDQLGQILQSYLPRAQAPAIPDEPSAHKESQPAGRQTSERAAPSFRAKVS